MEEIKYDLQKTGTSRKNLYIAVFIVNVGALTTGFVLGWSSPSLVLLQSPDSEFYVSKWQGAWLASLVPLGMIIGPFLAGLLLDNVGRRQTVLCYEVMILVGWGLMSVWSIWLFYAGRLLMGVAEGISLAVTSVYIAEISEDSVRGTLNTLMPIFIRVPILLAYSVGPHISHHGFISMSCIPIIVFLVLYKKLPESPHYLLLQNNENEAIHALSWLRQLPESSVLEEVKNIQASLSSIVKGSWQDLFTNRGNVRALLILSTLHTFQQVSGGTVLFFYTQTIFNLSGISVRSDLCASFVAAMMIVGTILPPPLVRMWGYKKPLFWSTLGSAVCLGFLAFSIQQCKNRSKEATIQWLVVVSLAAYTVVNLSGLSPLPWPMMGEYFPPSVRAKGSTIATCVFSLEAFIFTILFPHAVSVLGLPFTCWFGCATLLVAAVFVVLFVPETSGLSFSQIQEILNR